MFGLEQIKAMNTDPERHIREEMSDGQERRNNDPGRSYWSETTPDLGQNVASEPEFSPDFFGIKRDSSKTPLNSLSIPSGPRMAENLAEMQLPPLTIGYGAIGKNEAIASVMEVVKKPPEYFNGVALRNVLRQQEEEASTRLWRIDRALSYVHEADTQSEMDFAQRVLIDTMNNLKEESGNRELKLRMAIEELANTIDGKLPEPKGYVPHLGLHYLFGPLRKIVTKMENVFKRG